MLIGVVQLLGKKVGKPTCSFWIDHTPRNLDWTGVLSEMFPSAKFIHIVRDGRGVAGSMRRLIWGPNTIEGAAQLWAERLSHALAAESIIEAGMCFRVHYEDLLRDPEAKILEICDFIGLEYNEAMLRGVGFDVPNYTRRQHRLVGSMPCKEKVNEWERLLTSREIEIFEALCGALLEYFGYPLKYGLGARPPRTAEKIKFALLENLQRSTNRIRYRLHQKKEGIRG
jgi:hypothetical protein